MAGILPCAACCVSASLRLRVSAGPTDAQWRYDGRCGRRSTARPMLKCEQEALTMSILDPEAAQLLRRAIQLGNPGRTTVDDLRMAVDHPVPMELPPSRLRGDAPLAQLLRRAMDLARNRGVDLVSRADLIEAL